MEEHQMQSINELKQWKQFFSMKENATPATRRDRPHASITGGTVFGVLVLLFLASVIYLVFQGGFDAVSSPRAKSPAVAAKPADAGGAQRNESASGGPAASPDYFPAGYVNRGRDGDGNVMTYEHD
jgi:hypothetical protein